MNGDKEPVFTFSPLVDRTESIVGLRLGVHPGADASMRTIAQSLNDVAQAWPPADVPVHVALKGAVPDPGLAAWKAPAGAVLEFASTPQDEAWLATMNGHRPQLCSPFDVEGRADVVSIPAADVRGAPPAIERRGRRRAWIATDSDDPMSFAASMHHGAWAASGWAFLRQLPAVGSQLLGSPASIASLIEMLDRDAAIEELEAVLRRDAVLMYRVFTQVTAASFGLPVEVHSCRDAITVLGRGALKRWLASLPAAGSRDEYPPAWRQLSMLRAVFLERLGIHLGDGWNADDLFLCGAFSLLDRVFRVPFEQVFRPLAVSEPIRDALVDRVGPLTPLMDVVYSLERGEQARVREKIGLLALSPSQVNRALIEAFTAVQRG